MADKSYEGPFRYIGLFSKNLPSNGVLVLILFLISIGAGIVSSVLLHYNLLGTLAEHIIISGLLWGIIAIMLPAALTMLMVKTLKRYIQIRYILFVTIIAAFTYAIFAILASSIYFITGIYSFNILVILLGDAAIFAWWMFVNKMLINKRLNLVPIAIIQPTLNVLFFIPSNNLVFVLREPLNLLIIKLYAGIFVFLLISYMIMYVLDTPLKKSLGFSGIDMLSGFLQNWLFSINMSMAKKNKSTDMNVYADINADVVAFKAGKKLKAVLFIPNIHYGPVGTLGSSNFPYMLEKYINSRYGCEGFVMHTAVTEDNNAVSSDQYQKVRAALDAGIKNCEPVRAKHFAFAKGRSGSAEIKMFSFGDVAMATFTRGPRVTEDIGAGAAAMFGKMLEERFKYPILIDAHNSRYESAPKEELAAVRPNSIAGTEYAAALMACMSDAGKNSAGLIFGSAKTELYHALGMPDDLGPGNLNVGFYKFEDLGFAMIHFNANNMAPKLRSEIIKHVGEKFKIGCEVYTTDTHYVNSLGSTASNVLGNKTSYSKLAPIIDRTLEAAMRGAEPVEVCHSRQVIKRFRIWGTNQRDKVMAALSSMMALAKLIIPIIVIAGFLLAAIVISDL